MKYILFEIFLYFLLNVSSNINNVRGCCDPIYPIIDFNPTRVSRI